MKKVNTLCLLFMIIASRQLNAQCSLCTPVFSNCPSSGGLCNSFDTAYAQSNYDQVINFYIPTTLTSSAALAECHCNVVDVNSITITGITGLPIGINYTLSNGGQYNVQNGDTVGCVHFCGTPLLSGNYTVTVNLSADVTAIGTPLGNVNQNGVAQSFSDPFVVMPDTSGGVSSFTYGNNGSTACDSISITLNAVLSAPSPNLTRYFWKLPDGQTSQLQSPGSYTFTNSSSVPDTIPITLTTTFYNYVIEEIYITDIIGRYKNGADDTYLCIPYLSDPDPYIKVPLVAFDNSANYVSNQCTDVDFNNLAITIPLGTQTVNFEIWDKDFLSADDSIGGYTLNAARGIQNFSDINAYGWVLIDTMPGTTVTETLHVIVNPTPPTPVVTASQDTFCSSDSVLLLANAGAGNYVYKWYTDTTLLIHEHDSSFYTSVAGMYKVVVTDASSGCSSNPSTYQTITIESAPPSPIAIVHIGTQVSVTPYAAGLKVNWSFNSTPITGYTGAVIPYLGDGIYNAMVYNPSYPACYTMAVPDTVITAGINEVSIANYNLNIMPNPNNGNFKISFSSDEMQDISLNVRNLLGQEIYSRNLENFNGQFEQEITLDGLSKGIYIISVESARGRQYVKMIVQ